MDEMNDVIYLSFIMYVLFGKKNSKNFEKKIESSLMQILRVYDIAIEIDKMSVKLAWELKTQSLALS